MPASPQTLSRYRLEDLRALATNLAVGVGVYPARASALATHLLWFDAAGASSHGMAALPAILEGIDRNEIQPTAEGRVHGEKAGIATLDGMNGLPPLILDRAAGIASEKARDVGIGMVRVQNLGRSGPMAPVVASLAIGPYLALIVGPDGSLAVALPSPQGLPLVFDSSLSRESGQDSPGLLREWSPWTSMISGGEGWVILAITLNGTEPMSAIHVRLATEFGQIGSSPGRILPGDLEARRLEAREQGVGVDDATLAVLKFRADRLGVAWPGPIGG